MRQPLNDDWQFQIMPRQHLDVYEQLNKPCDPPDLLIVI